MKRVYNMEKDQLLNYLKCGYSNRKISELTGISKSQVSYLVRKFNLQEYYNKPKYDIFKLDKIDTKELAYLVGFIIADSYIKNEVVEISIKEEDKEVLDLFSSILGIGYKIDKTIDKEKRRFPRVRLSRKITGINKFISGEKKEDRIVPIVSKDLEVYILRGIFDADGCINWGIRKDRNRVWHKVCFNSSLKILTSVQKILYKNNITTMIKPKSGEEKCFVLEFSNKKDIINFYNYLYSDTSFIPLKRKFDNYNALRLELGEFGETINNTTLSNTTDLSVGCQETTGEINGSLNDQISTQDSNKKS